MTLSSPTAHAVQLRLPELSPDAVSYAVFDLETTGLDANTSQIIEIGWCVVRNQLAGKPRALLVTCEGGVPPEIRRLTGISNEMLAADGQELGVALTSFLDETDGLPLVGHNVLRFDMLFVEAACRKTGKAPPARNRYRDTAALYRASRLGMSPRPGQDHWSFASEALDRRAPGLHFALHVCCAELGIAIDGVARHRAGGDVQITRQLYAKLMELDAGSIRLPLGVISRY
jgi:DNA polymerase III epsilon subunit-like protein